MINWEELFEEENVMFHCETEELAIKLLKIAHEFGYSWNSTESYETHSKWNTFKEETCYHIRIGMYADYQTYDTIYNKIINVKDLFESENPKLLKRR
jgi:hypothetical protein